MSEPTNREVAVLNAALELRPAERAAYLDRACAGNAALRRQVEELLRAHAAAEGFLETPPTGLGVTRTVRVTVPLTEKPGDKISHYKLLQQIGEGGCGVVYMAEQEEPVRRRVALKVIKLGMDTKQVIARFEAERQALALMDHPNIAKIFDAGITETPVSDPEGRARHSVRAGVEQSESGAQGTDAPYLSPGRPYFVMELVRGIKITDFSDENKLSTEERLKLFIQVCQAIQHAHQKGVIHRDIKPSNILVTVNDGVPVPKVIDFGIAKATQGRLTDHTLFTAFEQFIGTPAYMSPEQAVMTSLDIDTRSDIYSLGVLLYELLTGRTPFDAKELFAAGLDEMRRTIREKEPPRPSTRLSTMAADALTTTAKQHHTDAPKLIHLLRGDLDWIVMKALEKDRARRYETAKGLADDIQRHLKCEPVLARPPSRLYEFQKTVRRHKFGFAAAGLVGLALVFGLVGSCWQAIRARKAEREQSRLYREAEEARGHEAGLRSRAEEGELLARQNLYAADVILAQQAFLVGNWGRARGLLDGQRPKSGQPDLRGFEWRHIWSLTRGDSVATLYGHDGAVASLGVSPDGKTLLSAGQGNKGDFLWDLVSRRIVTRIPKIPSAFPSVAISPDGEVFAIASYEGKVLLWTVNTRRGKLQKLPGEYIQLAFSPAGGLLACATTDSFGSERGDITLWNYSTGERAAAFPGAGTRLAFSPDGKRLAMGSSNQVVRVIDLASRQTVSTLQMAASVWAITFTPDGLCLVASCRWGPLAGVLQVWDLGKEEIRVSLADDMRFVWSMAFSPDGQTMATVSADSKVRLWDVATWRVREVFRGHGSEVWCVAFTPDGQHLLTGSKDETIKLWPMHSSRTPETIEDVRAGPIFSPDGSLIATANSKGQPVLTSTAAIERTWTLDGVHNPVGFSADGMTLITISSQRTLTRWDVAARLLRSETKLALDGPIDAYGLSSDGRMFFSARNSPQEVPPGTVTVLDAITGEQIGTLSESRSRGDIKSSPDNRWIVSVLGGEALLWDAATLKHVTTSAGHSMHISCTAFSPDGRILATGGLDGVVILWDVAAQKIRGTLRGHVTAVNDISFSPDGKTLASCSDETLKLWSLATVRETAAFILESVIARVVFSPDNRVLAVRTESGKLHLLRAPGLEEIAAAESSEAKMPQR